MAGETATEVRLADEAGRAALWGWFGLSYSSFLTMPRVLMHSMPGAWQAKMAALLEEYDATFPNMPEGGTVVRRTDRSGKLVPFDDWMLNYRYPNHAEIDRLRFHEGLKS